jgi:hypothetical protein
LFSSIRLQKGGLNSYPWVLAFGAFILIMRRLTHSDI